MYLGDTERIVDGLGYMPGSLQILVSLFFVFGNLGCVVFFTMVSVCKARQAGLLKNVNKHFCHFDGQN